ncbi:hypothetical protein JB92DRAFT_2870153 [Gautieria morchelliformis]|nr:hypothetical protein JB92DRAFT_2870153 [Gautieria morchelliformis]
MRTSVIMQTLLVSRQGLARPFAVRAPRLKAAEVSSINLGITDLGKVAALDVDARRPLGYSILNRGENQCDGGLRYWVERSP